MSNLPEDANLIRVSIARPFGAIILKTTGLANIATIGIGYMAGGTKGVAAVAVAATAVHAIRFRQPPKQWAEIRDGFISRHYETISATLQFKWIKSQIESGSPFDGHGNLRLLNIAQWPEPVRRDMRISAMHAGLRTSFAASIYDGGKWLVKALSPRP